MLPQQGVIRRKFAHHQGADERDYQCKKHCTDLVDFNRVLYKQSGENPWRVYGTVQSKLLCDQIYGVAVIYIRIARADGA